MNARQRGEESDKQEQHTNCQISRRQRGVGCIRQSITTRFPPTSCPLSASINAAMQSSVQTNNEAAGGPLEAFRREFALLRQRWHIILCCLVLQYVHGIATQLAYRMHRPAQQPLHDLGFELLPELPAEWRWLSEALFTTMFVSFVLWTFLPLLRPRPYSVVLLWTRLLTVLVVCQALRIISFSSTQLPGPAPHCRLGTPTAFREPAKHWWQHVVVDVSRQLSHSCGDLIFSSHMTFVLLGVLTYQHYGRSSIVKALVWAAAVAVALLIVAARKHYTVDVVIAWYTVPLVYCCLNMYWHMQQQQLSAAGLFPHINIKSAAGPGEEGLPLYSTCCISDSCAAKDQCAGSCYSPLKKSAIRSAHTTPGSSNNSSARVQQVQLSQTDSSAVITLPRYAAVNPTPVALGHPVSPVSPGLAAVWSLGRHRRGGSGGSTTSSSSSSSGSTSSDHRLGVKPPRCSTGGWPPTKQSGTLLSAAANCKARGGARSGGEGDRMQQPEGSVTLAALHDGV